VLSWFYDDDDAPLITTCGEKSKKKKGIRKWKKKSLFPSEIGYMYVEVTELSTNKQHTLSL